MSTLESEIPDGDFVDRCTAESLIGLCQDYGLRAVPARLPGALQAESELEERVGLIGFEGSGLSGIVAVSLPSHLVAMLWPARGSEQADDWIAELTNQFMGRLKNRWLSRGIALRVTSPAIIPASLAFVQAHAVQGQWTRFNTDQGMVAIGIGMAPPLSVAPAASQHAEVAAEEGELILF